MALDTDSFWDTAAAMLHGAVDGVLADRVRYSIDAGLTFNVLPAFVIDEVDGESGVPGLDDDFSTRKRVKIRKALIPSVDLSHRIEHPRLGPGRFRPTNSVPQDAGEYWLFDVQKVA